MNYHNLFRIIIICYIKELYNYGRFTIPDFLNTIFDIRNNRKQMDNLSLSKQDIAIWVERLSKERFLKKKIKKKKRKIIYYHIDRNKQQEIDKLLPELIIYKLTKNKNFENV